MLDDLEPLIRAAMAEWKIPGLAIAVVQEDAPPLVAGYGHRDVAAGLPVSAETQFLLCSVTKSITAAGLLMLVEDRRLDLSKPVRDIIPEFRLHDAVATERVTVRDLLCHQTGLPRHDWVWMPGDLSLPQMLAALRHLEPSHDLRAEYQYSNLGYAVAGLVAERVAGQPWPDFIRDRLFAPLGMGATTGLPALQAAADRARPYWMVEDEPKPAPFFPVAALPAGGVNASATDMAAWLRFLLGGGPALLPPAALRRMQTPLAYTSRSEFEEIGDGHYGFGLACYHYRGERAVAHDGGWIGWGTRIDMLPDRGLGIAVLTNRAPSPVTSLLCHAVFDRVCGKEAVPWFDRFQKRRQDVLANIPAAKAARENGRKPGTAPSHPLADLAGAYEHPAYGRVVVTAEGDALCWRFRGMSGALDHRHHDVFALREAPEAFIPDGLTITFGYDRDGVVDRLSAPFEPAVDPIVFRRAPDGDSLDPAFRAACVGHYEVAPQTHAVALDANGQLTLQPSDQPMYRLQPYGGRTFSIAGLEGYRVEFQADAAGVVGTLVFHQPNGTFRATRIPAPPA